MSDSLVGDHGVHLGAILTCDTKAHCLIYLQVIAALVNGRFVDEG